MHVWSGQDEDLDAGATAAQARSMLGAAGDAVGDAAPGVAGEVSGDEHLGTAAGAGWTAASRETRRAAVPTPLALVIGARAPDQEYLVTWARWSGPALAALAALDRAFACAAHRVSVPVVALRARLELADGGLQRVEIGERIPSRAAAMLWTLTEVAVAGSLLNDVVLGWLVNEVDPLTRSAGDEAVAAVSRLKQLARDRRALETEQRAVTPYHWQVAVNGTAKPATLDGYADLADFVAHCLAGIEAFPGLPGLRRVAGGELTKNKAELMTDPITIGRRSRFSLVVRVRVLSYPGRPKPVVVIDFMRRVWADALKQRPGHSRVSAYALPDAESRALRFTVVAGRSADGTQVWLPADDLAPIARRYLPGEDVTIGTILREGHQMAGCKLLVGLRHGFGLRADVKHGVPDRDKVEAFERIAAALLPFGLEPWHGLEKVESSTRSPRDRNQHWGHRADPLKRNQYEQWIAETEESLRDLYADEHHLVIGVQPAASVQSDAVEAERLLREILPGHVRVVRIPLPVHVHGPRQALPGADLRAPARASLRMAEWDGFIEAVRRHEREVGRRVDGVLVLAHEWYPGPRHDDVINKRAGRIALATGVGVPVQYLRPSDEDMLPPSGPRGKGSDEAIADGDGLDAGVLEQFEHRLMIAWLDLAYASIGRVRTAKLREELGRLYGAPTAEGQTTAMAASPDRIMALGVVQRNVARFRDNERSFLPYAIELNLATGVCAASFVYEDPATRAATWSDPLPLPQALVALARLGPVQLTSVPQGRRQELQDRMQVFFKARLSEFCAHAVRPMVVIDADTCRGWWPWVADAHLEPDNVQLANGYNAQAAWPHARIVRVRTANAPKVLWDDAFGGKVVGTGERIIYRATGWAKAELFRVVDAVGPAVYLSFGADLITKRTRGVSCYRSVQVLRRAQKGYEVTVLGPRTDAWATPSGVEFVVVRAADDTPERLARLTEWLRQCFAHVGDWTRQPAPLFFARLLKQYLADYGLEEEDGDMGTEGDLED